jgi:hypothetical protein
MKTRKYTILPLAGLAIATSPVDAATTLTGLGGGSGSAAVPTDHGSNEAGTLNIALDWSTAGNWDQYPNWNGRGDVYQIQDSSGGSPASVVFTPDAGFAATITSFDLDEWAGGGATTVDWIVSGGTSGTLASGTWDDFSIANGGRSTVTPNVTGANGEALTLSFGQTGGSSAYLALDNLTFDQVAIPEPSSTTLAALGLGAMAMRRRRK